MAPQKRTRKKASKPARGKKVARKKKAARKATRKNKPVRQASRAASLMNQRRNAKPAARFPEDTLGDWQQDAHAGDHGVKHDSEDDDFVEIGGSE